MYVAVVSMRTKEKPTEKSFQYWIESIAKDGMSLGRANESVNTVYQIYSERLNIPLTLICRLTDCIHSMMGCAAIFSNTATLHTPKRDTTFVVHSLILNFDKNVL